MPNHYIGDLLHTIAMSGLSRVRTEFSPLAVIAALAPHPVQMHCEFPGHCHLGNLPSTPHGEVKERTAPLRLTAHRDLRRFHQQEAEQHIALLADVTEPAAVAAGLFRRNQSYITGNLLAAVKTFRRSDHQLESQGRERTLRSLSPP